jgi:glutamate/tyrosine decarboxylase-like PLP-dependent enzyme
MQEGNTSTKVEEHHTADSAHYQSAPQWAKFRSDMLKSFPSPYRGERDSLADGIDEAIRELDKLKPEKAGGAAFLGTNPALTIDFENVKNSSLNPKMSTSGDVIKQVIKLFEGLPNWGHPLTMCNVSPQGNTAAIVAAILTEIFAPNILEGEYAWNIHQAELESAGILANLAGWEPKKSGCVYTYGGSGCWTYHLKYALTRVLPDSRNKGIRTDAKVICSQQAHYTMLNSTDWMGLGMDNIIRIKTDVDSNAMDTSHLEEVLKDCQAKKIPVASVVCTMATTDASAFDPVEDVRTLLNKYPNPRGYGKALLYCDSVIGWAWIAFKNYDFKTNPLGFSEAVLPYLEKNYNAIKGIFYADAFGVDFHKTGFSPYISSAFVYKNAEEFESLLSRGSSAYLQPRSPYNPLNYTLEVSRAATGSMAGWATLKFFGHEGFQSVLGGILENKVYLQNQIAHNPEMVCVNPSDYGLVTLVRVYPKDVDARVQFDCELRDPAFREDLIKHNKLTRAIGDTLFEWFRSGKKINGRCTPYLSYSTGFRTAEYNRGMKDSEAVIYAIKMFPMNVYITPEVMNHVLECVNAARDDVITKQGRRKTGSVLS